MVRVKGDTDLTLFKKALMSRKACHSMVHTAFNYHVKFLKDVAIQSVEKNQF